MPNHLKCMFIHLFRSDVYTFLQHQPTISSYTLRYAVQDKEYKVTMLGAEEFSLFLKNLTTCWKVGQKQNRVRDWFLSEQISTFWREIFEILITKRQNKCKNTCNILASQTDFWHLRSKTFFVYCICHFNVIFPKNPLLPLLGDVEDDKRKQSQGASADDETLAVSWIDFDWPRKKCL